MPWTCAGDVITAVAMLTLKLLGGAALSHEIETLDHAAGEALLATSGEHDLAFADPTGGASVGAWAHAGVNHHAAATRGRYSDAVAAVAAHLGVGAMRVST